MDNKRCGIYNGILLSHKNNEITPSVARWTDLEIIILTERRERQMILYHLDVESKIWYKWVHLQNRNRFTDTENKFMVARAGKEGREIIWEFGISRYKLHI